MRAFIGFDFSKQFKDHLTNIQGVLKQNAEKGTWVSPSNFHLTLKFLGEIDDSQTNSIDKVLKQLSLSNFPITVRLKSLGYFNKKDDEYRVLWLGLDGQMNEINKIYKELEQSMYHLGFDKEERKFNPHITLGRRIITDIDFNILRELVKPYLGKEFILDNLVLMKSEIIMGKRVYTPIKSYKLNDNIEDNHR